jgi:hypothetical protein
MSCLRLFVVLLTLLSSGFVHASIAPFDEASRVGDDILDRMRGGFVVSFNGQDFLLPFSITGIERLTQIGNQTYINGQLVSPSVNPQALTTISQTNQLGVSVQPLAPVPQAPAAQTPVAQTPATQTPVAQTPATQTSITQAPIMRALVAQTPAAQTPVAQTPAAQTLAAQTLAAQTPAAQAPIAQAPVTVSTGAATAPQVTTSGQLIVIQNGAANTVVLPPNVSLDSLATYIQNSVNDQVIRNITTLNITIESRMLAAQARLNAALNQSLNGLR